MSNLTSSGADLMLSSSSETLHKLLSKFVQSMLSDNSSVEQISIRASNHNNIDEMCVKKSKPLSNHTLDENNDDVNDDTAIKYSTISVSTAYSKHHDVSHGIVEYREKSKLLKKLSELNNKLTHEKILLLAIGEYIKRDFAPSYIYDLIEMTKRLARNSNTALSTFSVPFILEDREKLLKYFYEEAYEHVPSEQERKIIFILTLLQVLKNLGDSIFTQTHPRNRSSSLRLSFIMSNLFFAIPFYKFIFDWFSFNDDSIPILLLFVKFMEIKMAKETAAWAKFVRPMTFRNATVLLGSRNPFNRKNSASKIKCTVNLTASCDMIEAIKGFMRTGEFQWEKAAKEFSVHFEFSCPRNRVGEIDLFFSREMID